MTCSLQEIQCLDLWEEDQILNDNYHRSLSDTSMSSNTTNTLSHGVKEYLNSDNNSYLCGSKFRITRSDTNNLWHTHINHFQENCTNECKHIGLYHLWSNTSFHNDILKQLTERIDLDAEDDDRLKTNSIIICSECKIPSNRYNNTTHDILQAHPHYRPGQNLDNSKERDASPWHDWVEVQYDTGIACGKVLLWCWIEFPSEEISNSSYAMVQTLTGQGREITGLTVLGTYDSIVTDEEEIQLIPCSAVKSVAYVLPSIRHDDTNRSEYHKYFSTNQDENKNFMIINPVELWT